MKRWENINEIRNKEEKNEMKRCKVITTTDISMVHTVYCEDVCLYHILIPVCVAGVVPSVDQLQAGEVQRPIHEDSDVLWRVNG